MSTLAVNLQQDFDALTDMFNCVGLRNNVANMVSMACQSFRELWGHYAEAYILCMMEGGGGGGNTYWEQLRQKVCCPECNAELASGSLVSHRQFHHGVDWGNLRDTPTPWTIVGVRSVPTGYYYRGQRAA